MQISCILFQIVILSLIGWLGFDCWQIHFRVYALSIAVNKRPNILFILMDDIGKEYIEPYGAVLGPQPSMSKLAKEGALFHHFYSMPQCTPSRATLMTGQYPYHHGYSDHWGASERGHTRFLPDAITYSLGNLMKEAGYTTAVFGKWQINDFRRELNVMHKMHGIDTYAIWTGEEAIFNSKNKQIFDSATSLRYTNPILVHKHAKETVAKRSSLEDLNIVGSELGYSSDAAIRNYTPYFLRDAIKKFIDDQLESKNPWFLYYSMLLPHGEGLSEEYSSFFNAPNPEDVSGLTSKKHFSMVKDIDFIVGTLVDHIDKRNIAENTLIILTGDNGAPKNLRAPIKIDGKNRMVAGGKGAITENGINMPFIARWKGTIIPRVDSETLFSLADMLPTFADLIGINLSEDKIVDGKSMAEVFLKNKSWLELYPNQADFRECAKQIASNAYNVQTCPRYLVVQGGGSDAFVDGSSCARQSKPFREKSIISMVKVNNKAIKVKGLLNEDKTYNIKGKGFLTELDMYGTSNSGAKTSILDDPGDIEIFYNAIRDSLPNQDYNFRNQLAIESMTLKLDEPARATAKIYDDCNRTAIDY